MLHSEVLLGGVRRVGRCSDEVERNGGTRRREALEGGVGRIGRYSDEVEHTGGTRFALMVE